LKTLAQQNLRTSIPLFHLPQQLVAKFGELEKNFALLIELVTLLLLTHQGISSKLQARLVLRAGIDSCMTFLFAVLPQNTILHQVGLQVLQ